MHKTNYHPQHPQNQHFNEYLLDINKTEIPTDKGVNSYTMEEAKIQNWPKEKKHIYIYYITTDGIPETDSVKYLQPFITCTCIWSRTHTILCILCFTFVLLPYLDTYSGGVEEGAGTMEVGRWLTWVEYWTFYIKKREKIIIFMYGCLLYNYDYFILIKVNLITQGW